MKKTNWIEVVTFFTLACAFSWPFFVWRDLYPFHWESSMIPKVIRKLGLMWGPGISALICFIIFRKTHKRTTTLFGTSILKSLIFYLFPFLVWIVLDFVNPNENSVKIELFLQLIPIGFLMILGEELGWRYFLQDSLGNLKEWKKWLTLGIMWEFWHFTRGLTNGELPIILIRKTIFILAVILLTIIIGKATIKTKSLLVAITIHSWVNIQFQFPNINTFIAGGLSLIIWGVLIWKWDSEKLVNTM